MMKMRMRPMEVTRTGTENQDSKMAREENRTATTTTMVPSTPNTATRGGRDEDAEDDEGKGGMMRGRGKGYTGRRDSRDRAYMQEDTHYHSAQGMVPPG
jgi:hypothetical protein